MATKAFCKLFFAIGVGLSPVEVGAVRMTSDIAKESQVEVTTKPVSLRVLGFLCKGVDSVVDGVHTKICSYLAHRFGFASSGMPVNADVKFSLTNPNKIGTLESSSPLSTNESSNHSEGDETMSSIIKTKEDLIRIQSEKVALQVNIDEHLDDLGILKYRENLKAETRLLARKETMQTIQQMYNQQEELVVSKNEKTEKLESIERAFPLEDLEKCQDELKTMDDNLNAMMEELLLRGLAESDILENDELLAADCTVKSSTEKLGVLVKAQQTAAALTTEIFDLNTTINDLTTQIEVEEESDLVEKKVQEAKNRETGSKELAAEEMKQKLEELKEEEAALEQKNRTLEGTNC